MPAESSSESLHRPAWQLPPGVSRSIWEYVHQSDAASIYAAHLHNTPLAEFDAQWLARHFTQPGKLIDLGCGTGRHALAFAQRGFEVAAVDLSPSMLEAVQQSAHSTGVHVQTRQANLCELDEFPTTGFDYALCMFSTLGLVNGPAARRRVLDHIARILKPGGRFALHVHNLWSNLCDPQGRRWLIGDMIRRLRKLSDAGDKPHFDQGIPQLAMHVFTRGEILRLLARAGFQVVECLPLSRTGDGPLAAEWCLGGFRANGWLLEARRAG